MRSLVLALVSVALSASAVAGHTLSPGHYNAACNTSSSAEPNGFIWARHSASGSFPGGTYTGVGRVLGAQGTITARALIPCTNGDNSHVTKSLILAVDLQGTGANGVFQFTQLGLGKYDSSLGTGCTGKDSTTSAQTMFVYMKPLAGGSYCRAGWFDPDNDGNPNDPVGGTDYRFSITEVNVGAADYWRYCITIVSTGVGDCHDDARTSSDGGLADSGSNPVAWWGCEVGNTANGTGIANGTAEVTLREASYEKASNPGVWNYTEGSTLYGGWRSVPSYYTYGQSQTGLGESIYCRTNFHTS